MKSLPAFYFLEPEPLIKAMVKTKKVHVNLGSWKGLAIIAIGPRNGKIVGYRSDGKPIYAGSAAAEQLVQILQAKKTYTPAQQDLELVKWLKALGLQGAVDAEHIYLSKEGATLMQSAFSVGAEHVGGGKWTVKKAQLLPHLGEPLKPSEEHITSWAAEMASGEYKGEEFPPLHTLKEVSAGKFAGSHGNQLFEDKSGKKWVFKPADPTISRAEEAASRIGRLLLGDRIPLSKYVKVKGKDGVLIQVLPGEVWQESSSQHSDPQMSYLKKYADQVVEHEVVDWLVSNHDSHAGNFLADGEKLTAIDKGQAWKWIGEDKLDPSYKGSNPSYQIYKKFWQSVHEGKIDSKGLVEAVAKVIHRAEQISPEQFALIVAPYVSTWAGGHDEDPHAQLQKMTKRLSSLREDFEKFLSKQLGKVITLPKPSPVQVDWEAAPAPKPEPEPVQLPTPTAPIPAVLQETEKAPVTAGAPKAGWPLTKKGPKTSATIVDPGKIPPANWPAGTPSPGLHLQCDYKGKSYTLIVQESLFESGKPKFKVLYPNGKEETFKSLNAAGDSLYLFNQGMPLDMNATEKKKQGISLGSKVFQLKQFEKELAEAYGKAEEPVPVAVATPAQLEEQKIIEPEQKEISVMGLLAHLPDGEVLTQGAAELPQEVKEFLSAYQGYDQLTTGWDLALTPGYAVKVTNSSWQTKNTMILTARLSKEGKPELWGWWEGLDGKLKKEVYSGTTAIFWEKVLKIHENSALADLKAEYLKAAKLEEDQKKQAAQPVEPAGAPPEAVLPETAVVPESAPKYTAGPLAIGTVLKVKKKVPGYDKKQEVTLTVLIGGKLLVEIPGQTAQTFETLSAASDHVWVVQKGYADAADYKAKNKTNKVPSGGGWKFWGISPAAAPAAQAAEPGAGGGVVPAAPAVPAPTPATVKSKAADVDYVTIDDFKELLADEAKFWQQPIGTKIVTEIDGETTVFQKVNNNAWTMDGKGSLANAQLIGSGLIEPLKVIEWTQPKKKSPQPAGGGTTLEFLQAAAIGTKIKTDDGNGNKTTYEKVFPDSWKVTLINKFEAADTAEFSTADAHNMMQDEKVESWEGPGAPIPEPDTATKDQVELVGKIKEQAKTHSPKAWDEIVKHLIALPAGIVIKTVAKSGEEYHYTKQANQIWKVKAPGLAGTVDVPNGSLATDLSHEAEKIVAFTPAGGVSVPEKTAADDLKDKIEAAIYAAEVQTQLDAAPIGTVIVTKTGIGTQYVYTKLESDQWSMVGGAYGEIQTNAHTTASNMLGEPVISVKLGAGGTATGAAGEENWEWFQLHPVEAAAKVQADIKSGGEQFGKLPAGAKLQFSTEKGMDVPLHTAVKNEKGNWDLTWEDGKKEEHTLEYMTSMLSHPEVTTKQLVGPGAGFIGEVQVVPEKEETASLEELQPDLPISMKSVADFPKTLEEFKLLPIGSTMMTVNDKGTQWIYTKINEDYWKAKKGKSDEIFTGLNDVGIFSDVKTEKLLTFGIPTGAAISAPPPQLSQKLDSIVSYVDLPNSVKDALKTVQLNLLTLHDKDPAKLQKPAAWAGWVPPPALILHGSVEGEKFYVFNSAMAQNNDGSVNTEIRFSVVLPDGTIYTGNPSDNPVLALGYAMDKTGIILSGIDTKEALGLYGVTFPTGATEADPFLDKAGGISGKLKPAEQMTPTEKTAKVKVNMPLKQALKVHPGLQEGKLKIKKAKGGAMYICLDGIEGASTKLYNALQDLGVAHAIKNAGGIPKINAQGAFVAVDGWVLDQEVTVETTALDASSEQHAPSDPNWQTMPKAKSKKKTKAQKEAEAAAKQKAEELKAKAAEIKTWGEQHPAVTDKAALQVLAALQGVFAQYKIPIGAIARMDGDQVVLSHKTHQAQLEKLVSDLANEAAFPYEMVTTPWGDAVKLSVKKLKEGVEKATGMTIGGIITGPDGKEYPVGTTFQHQTTETTVEQLLPGEPGFYKIKEHNKDPENLALLKISGSGEEQQSQMKAMIVKYGLEGPFPEPKVSENSIVHAVFKKSLQKIWKTEETYEPTIPKQLPDFVPGSLPAVDTAAMWEEVGDGSADLHNLDNIKPSMFGHVLRVGAPGMLRDFCLKFNRIKDANGKMYYEITGDLVSFDGVGSSLKTGKVVFNSTATKETKASKSDVSAMNYDPDTGVHTESATLLELADPHITYLNGYVGQTSGGSSITVVPPSAVQDSLKNTFRIRIPMGMNPVEELREAFQKMGKDPDAALAPITDDADRIFKKYSLVRGAMGARGWNEDSLPPDKMHNEAWLDAKLGSLGIKKKVAGLRIVKTFCSQVSVISDDPEEFKDWDFGYVGSNEDGTFLQLLQGEGWASRRNRLEHGIWTAGQSAEEDFQNGGAKASYMRVASASAEVSPSYDCQVILHPRVFQRTDWWRYNTDGYGTTTSHKKHFGAPISQSPGRYSTNIYGTNEICFENGVSIKDVVAIVVRDDEKRKRMIKRLKESGITEYNGRPVEDFLIPQEYKGVNVFKSGTAPKLAAVLGIEHPGKGESA